MFKTTCYIYFFNPLSSSILSYLFFPLKIKKRKQKKTEGVFKISSFYPYWKKRVKFSSIRKLQLGQKKNYY